jgi:hypothetical protein
LYNAVNVSQGRPTSAHRRATLFVKDSPEGRTSVFKGPYVALWGRKELTRRLLRYVKSKVELKGLTELSKTQRMIGLQRAV